MKIATSGCSMRYCEAMLSESSDGPFRSSTRIAGRTWRAIAIPERRSPRSPAIWTPDRASNACRSRARSWSLRWTSTTESELFTFPPASLHELDGVGRAGAALAPTGGRRDVVDEFAVQRAAGAGGGNVLDEERGEPD